jgi:hypothetical protein
MLRRFFLWMTSHVSNESRPTEFNTLMFWSEDELKELQGSMVLGN